MLYEYESHSFNVRAATDHYLSGRSFTNSSRRDSVNSSKRKGQVQFYSIKATTPSLIIDPTDPPPSQTIYTPSNPYTSHPPISPPQQHLFPLGPLLRLLIIALIRRIILTCPLITISLLTKPHLLPPRHPHTPTAGALRIGIMLRDQRRNGRMHASQHGRHVHVIAQAAGAELREEASVSAGEGEGYQL